MPLPPKPPKLISMREALELVQKGHKIHVSRQTVYNWARLGKHNVKLRTVTRAGQLYTTPQWVEQFVSSCGLR